MQGLDVPPRLASLVSQQQGRKDCPRAAGRGRQARKLVLVARGRFISCVVAELSKARALWWRLWKRAVRCGCRPEAAVANRASTSVAAADEQGKLSQCCCDVIHTLAVVCKPRY